MNSEINGVSAREAREGEKKWTAGMELKSTNGNPTPEEVKAMREELRVIDEQIAGVDANITGIVAKIQAGKNSPGREELKVRLEAEETDKKLVLVGKLQELRSQKAKLEERLKFDNDFFVPKEVEGKASVAPFTLQ